MRLVILDSGPLGLMANPRAGSRPEECRAWATNLTESGIRLFVPEIADYEVRRKRIHINSTQGVRRLDLIKETLEYAPITTDVMMLAAELWAASRSAGLPTAGPDSLDGDCILAAQAILAGGLTDIATIATDNVAHLSRYADARLWETITP